MPNIKFQADRIFLRDYLFEQELKAAKQPMQNF